VEMPGGRTSFTHAVVFGCMALYVALVFLPEASRMELVGLLGLNPRWFWSRGMYHTLLSYQFLHSSIQHLAGNMFTLFYLGRALEPELGSLRFSIIYLGSGALAGLTHTLLHPASNTALVGASGSIFGAIALLILLMPFKFTSVFIIPLPGVVAGLGLLSLEALTVVASAQPGVAHDVHLYGFIAGALGAFAWDFDKALKGLVVAVMVALALYLWVFHLSPGMV